MRPHTLFTARFAAYCAAYLLAALTLAAPARAQTPSRPQAPQLGRLFATPAERAQLDALRDGGAARPAEQGASVAAQEAAAALPPPAAPAPVELNGIVRRSSGKSTVWLNQVPQNDAANTLGKDATLSLRLSSGRKVVLKPGQSYKADEGTVGEADGR